MLSVCVHRAVIRPMQLSLALAAALALGDVE
jgi:hypothetical protein